MLIKTFKKLFKRWAMIRRSPHHPPKLKKNMLNPLVRLTRRLLYHLNTK